MNKSDWDKLYEEGRSYTGVSDFILDKLNLTGGNSLDVGCGKGELMRQLKVRSYTTTGIDLSDYSADKVGDFMTYDFGDQKFDLITANLVLAFIEDGDAFIKKILSLLKPDGITLIVTPVRHKDRQYSEHYKNISIGLKYLKSVLPAGYKLIHSNYGHGYEEIQTIWFSKNLGQVANGTNTTK